MSRMNPFPPPGLSPHPGSPLRTQMSNTSGISAMTAQTNLAGAMSVSELRNVLTDFYDFHDPFKGIEEINEVVNWAKKHGIKKLNKRLMEKYGENLVVRDDIVTNRESIRSNARAISALMTPGLVAPDQEDDYDVDDDQPFHRERRGTVVEEHALRNMVKAAITRLEKARRPQDIRNEVLNIYSLVQPDRLKQAEQGIIPNFVEEILNWTYRFGLPNLVKNLKEKYLGDFGEISAPDMFKSDEDIMIENGHQPVNLDELRDKLMAFYSTYNPEMARKGVEDLLKFVKKKGLPALNKKLRARYQDDIDTFNGEAAINFKKELFERLVNFYSVHDPSKIGDGLGKIIVWAEKRGEAALNVHLFERYKEDLSNY